MGDLEHPAAGADTPPPKVVGLGAPISVWIYFEVVEIPALMDAVADELGQYGLRSDVPRSGSDGELRADTADWSDHIGELRRMLTDLERAAATYVAGRFDVVWPTLLAHAVVRRAVEHAEQRVAGTGGSAEPARVALAAAQRTLRDLDAVDCGGLESVWL